MLKKVAFCGLLMMFINGSAMAESVNFDEFAASFQTDFPITSGSLTFSSNSTSLGVWTSPPNIGPSNNSPYLIDADSLLSFAKSDASAFKLESFDLALGWYQRVSSATITVTYELAAGGTVSAALPISTASFSTFAPDLTIYKATFDLSGAPGGYISMDNINISAVPEPGAWMLMCVGLVALPRLARRARR